MIDYRPFYPLNINLHYLQNLADWHFVREWPRQGTMVLWSGEFVKPSRITEMVTRLRDLMPNPMICILHPQPAYQQDPIRLPSDIGLHMIDLDKVQFYFEMFHWRSISLNPAWNPNTGRFLHTVGKCDKSWRILLLHALWRQGLLEHCDLSLYMDDALRTTCRKLLPDIGDEEYQHFTEECQLRLDPIQPIMGSAGSFHYDAYPFDDGLFRRTSFRLLNETITHDQVTLSEKTVITMANQHPFIMSSLPGTLQQLKRQGYRTFEKYLVCPEYDLETDHNKRRRMILENIRHWLSSINMYADDMQHDIEHNYQLLMTDIDQQYQSYFRIFKEVGHDHVARFLPINLQRSLWISQYYPIKDHSWPDCWTQEHFSLLPLSIQQECRERFDIKAKTLAI